MIKKIMCGVIAFTFMCIANVTTSKASVNYGAYITPKIGYSFYTGDYITGHGSKSVKSGTSSFGGGVSVGYNFIHFFDVPVRVELEYMMKADANFEVDKRTMKMPCPKTLLANVFFDYHNTTDFVPYLMAGAGMSFIDTDSNFAWNVGAGLKYNFTENTAADFSVRYVDYGWYKYNHYSTNLTSIDTTLGLSYTF
jgi:opacity protein-like surface antigen